MNQKIIFISWTPLGRHTELLGKALGAKVFFFKKIVKAGGFLWKLLFPFDYLVKALKSFLIILETKPAIVFVQNPPSLAPIWVVALSRLFKFKTVIDSHNGAFEAPWFNVPLHIWALKNSNVVTVHNSELFSRLTFDERLKNINFKILNSRVSEFSTALRNGIKEKYFLVISSFSKDEPMDILLEGLRLFCNESKEFRFKVTGNYKKRMNLYNEFSKTENIEFQGFVDDYTYDYLLVNAFGVISLSTRDDVQQFALMEAVGAEVPFLSNDNLTNRALFGDNIIFVNTTPEKIAEGINLFIKDKERLGKNILELKNKIRTKWEKDFNMIKIELGI